jgi:O-antigen/teichoic acid export membrane protein
MCYVVQQPSTAVFGSGFHLIFVLAGLFFLRSFGHLGSFTAFLLMGLGSTFAALLLLWRLDLLKSAAEGESHGSWLAAFSENWTYGRWLVGSAVLYSISSQMQMFLVAGILGLGTAGVLRAMQLPSLLMTQVITATGLLFLPVLSRDFGGSSIMALRHKAAMLNVGLCLVAVFFASFLVLCSRWSEHLLFDGKYAAFAWLMPVLALVPVASGGSTGYSMALRASGRPHFDLLSNIIAAPISVLSAFLFIRWWGVAGAAASMVLSFTIISVVTIVCFRRAKWDNE